MPYVPPHKRSSSNAAHRGRPSHTPDSLAPLFNRSLSLTSSKPDRNAAGRIVYADRAVHEWFPVGLGADRRLLSSVLLKLATVDAIERRPGGRSSLALFSSGHSEPSMEPPPWSSIAKHVLPHLIPSFRVLRRVDEVESEVGIKPDLVARFGKILFHGSITTRAEDARNWVSESTLKTSKRTFYTNVPSAYVKDVTDAAVPKIGLEAEDEKEVYHVKLSDKLRPDATVSCKCRLIKEEKKLELYKVELNAIRHMVVDVSCLHKDLDLRLMLCAKRIIKALSEEELAAIKDLIGSAIVDSDVKGALRWPLGKNSSGSNRYDVVGVWHIISKLYRNSSLKLKVRQADRFDFRLSIGETTSEVTLKMRDLSHVLCEQNPEADSISEMLEKALKLIWENFLQSKHPVLEKVTSI